MEEMNNGTEMRNSGVFKDSRYCAEQREGEGSIDDDLHSSIPSNNPRFGYRAISMMKRTSGC